MRISASMQLILALALGLTLATGQATEPVMLAQLRGAPLGAWLRVLGGNMLTAAAIVGGLSLAVEFLRGQFPVSWGLGRWTWSMAMIYAGLNIGTIVAAIVASQVRRRGECPTWEVLRRVSLQASTDQFLGPFAWAWLAFVLTARLAGGPGGSPTNDLRERLGFEFGALTAATALIVRAFESVGI
ncbi:hypothetical protein EP7_004047 [Isosphaeraceae bacterium EP7]